MTIVFWVVLTLALGAAGFLLVEAVLLDREWRRQWNELERELDEE